MTISIPDRISKKWSQPNNSDIFGTLYTTKNLDFDKPGYLRLAKRVRSIFDESLNSGFGRPVCIFYFAGLGTDDFYYIITDEKSFYMDGSTLAVTEDTLANVPTWDSNGKSDGVVWNSQMYFTASGQLRRRGSNSWDASVLATFSTAGPLCVFENKNSLAVGVDNTVRLYDTNHSLTITLTLPSIYTVTSLAWSNNLLGVGTRHRGNGEALFFTWDGATTAANNGYSVKTHRIDSVKPYQESWALVNSDGRLLKFNGGGFTELGALPVYFTDNDWDVGGSGLTPLGRVLNRGMIVENDLIFIRLSAEINVSSDDDVGPNHFNTFPSGVWCYDPDIGLYHRYAQSGDLWMKSDAVATADVNTTTNVITINGQTVPETGTPVLYDDGSDGNGTKITPLKFRKKYYVIRVTGGTMKLAATRADAFAGTALDLTATGNALQYFIFLQNRDFGGANNTTPGAICLFKHGAGAGAIPSDARRIIFGGYAGKTTTDLAATLCVAAEKQENRGLAITPKVSSAAINDNWQNLTVKFRGIKTPEDKIIVKHRTVERFDELKFNNPIGQQLATWASTTSFTTTDPAFADADVGDEVEFTRGAGAGWLVHITAIEEAGGTYTVTIDETMQNITVGDTAFYYVDNWEKIGEITTDDCRPFDNKNGDTVVGIGGSKTYDLEKAGEWVQWKLELRGEDVEIEELLINNEPLNTFTA